MLGIGLRLYCTKEKQRDPDAHSAQKGNEWHFGYKAHIGVDKDTGLVHTLKVTAANVHDVTVAAKLLREDDEVVYGDSAYLGVVLPADAVDPPGAAGIASMLSEPSDDPLDTVVFAVFFILPQTFVDLLQKFTVPLAALWTPQEAVVPLFTDMQHPAHGRHRPVSQAGLDELVFAAGTCRILPLFLILSSFLAMGDSTFMIALQWCHSQSIFSKVANVTALNSLRS